MSDRFYTPQPLTPGEFTLDGPDAHHLSGVRRAVAGERVVLFNGDGREYPAEILAVGKKQVSLVILAEQAVSREVPFPLVVASALPKGDRLDFLIEKLTEVGATQFVPLSCERSVVQPKETTVEKLTRAVIEASKQCGRNALMVIDPPQKFAAFLRRTELPSQRFLLHTAEAERGSIRLDGVAFAVGPEGGFSPKEVAEATAAGWMPLSLGPRVLRVETAAVAAAVWAASAF